MSAFFFSTHPAMVVGAQTFASKEGGLLFKSCESSHQTKGCETAIWFAFLSIIIAIFFPQNGNYYCHFHWLDLNMSVC